MTSQSLTIPAGGGDDYDWANDHVYVKVPAAFTDGRVTLVEDRLKPGFDLPRHSHRQMTEIFYILEGEVTFEWDDDVTVATPGMTVAVPPGVWHHVTSPAGGRLLTIFTPGGFDRYMAELAGLTDVQLGEAALMTEISQRYDSWTG